MSSSHSVQSTTNQTNLIVICAELITASHSLSGKQLSNEESLKQIDLLNKHVSILLSETNGHQNTLIVETLAQIVSLTNSLKPDIRDAYIIWLYKDNNENPEITYAIAQACEYGYGMDIKLDMAMHAYQNLFVKTGSKKYQNDFIRLQKKIGGLDLVNKPNMTLFEVAEFERMADSGSVIHQYAYAFCLYNGLQGSKNNIESMKYYKKAAEQGHILSTYYYAVLDSCVNKDDKQKLAALEAALLLGAQKGSAVLQYELALYCDKNNKIIGGFNRNHWLRKSIAQCNEQALLLGAQKLWGHNETDLSDIVLKGLNAIKNINKTANFIVTCINELGSKEQKNNDQNTFKNFYMKCTNAGVEYLGNIFIEQYGFKSIIDEIEQDRTTLRSLTDLLRHLSNNSNILKKIIEVIKQYEDKKEVIAYECLAYLYASGIGVHKSVNRVMRYCENLAGSPITLNEDAWYQRFIKNNTIDIQKYLNNKGKLNYLKIKLDVKINDTTALYLLAESLLKQNKYDVTGISYLHKASDLYHVPSARLLGQTYLKQKEHTNAIEYLQYAATEGDDVAQVYLGDTYMELNNIESAKEWYTRAAEQGNSQAKNKLAELDKKSSDSVIKKLINSIDSLSIDSEMKEVKSIDYQNASHETLAREVKNININTNFEKYTHLVNLLYAKMPTSNVINKEQYIDCILRVKQPNLDDKLYSQFIKALNYNSNYEVFIDYKRFDLADNSIRALLEESNNKIDTAVEKLSKLCSKMKFATGLLYFYIAYDYQIIAKNYDHLKTSQLYQSLLGSIKLLHVDNMIINCQISNTYNKICLDDKTIVEAIKSYVKNNNKLNYFTYYILNNISSSNSNNGQDNKVDESKKIVVSTSDLEELKSLINTINQDCDSAGSSINRLQDKKSKQLLMRELGDIKKKLKNIPDKIKDYNVLGTTKSKLDEIVKLLEKLNRVINYNKKMEENNRETKKAETESKSVVVNKSDHQKMKMKKAKSKTKSKTSTSNTVTSREPQEDKQLYSNFRTLQQARLFYPDSTTSQCGENELINYVVSYLSCLYQFLQLTLGCQSKEDEASGKYWNGMRNILAHRSWLLTFEDLRLILIIISNEQRVDSSNIKSKLNDISEDHNVTKQLFAIFESKLEQLNIATLDDANDRLKVCIIFINAILNKMKQDDLNNLKSSMMRSVMVLFSWCGELARQIKNNDELYNYAKEFIDIRNSIDHTVGYHLSSELFTKLCDSNKQIISKFSNNKLVDLLSCYRDAITADFVKKYPNMKFDVVKEEKVESKKQHPKIQVSTRKINLATEQYKLLLWQNHSKIQDLKNSELTVTQEAGLFLAVVRHYSSLYLLLNQCFLAHLDQLILCDDNFQRNLLLVSNEITYSELELYQANVSLLSNDDKMDHVNLALLTNLMGNKFSASSKSLSEIESNTKYAITMINAIAKELTLKHDDMQLFQVNAIKMLILQASQFHEKLTSNNKYSLFLSYCKNFEKLFMSGSDITLDSLKIICQCANNVLHVSDWKLLPFVKSVAGSLNINQSSQPEVNPTINLKR